MRNGRTKSYDDATKFTYDTVYYTSSHKYARESRYTLPMYVTIA